MSKSVLEVTVAGSETAVKFRVLNAAKRCGWQIPMIQIWPLKCSEGETSSPGLPGATAKFAIKRGANGFFAVRIEVAESGLGLIKSFKIKGKAEELRRAIAASVAGVESPIP